MSGQDIRRPLAAALERGVTRQPVRYLVAAGVVTAATLLAIVEPPLDRVTVALCYLLGVVGVAAGAGYAPAVVAAVLSFIALNYFFIPPRFSLHVADPQSLIQLVTFLAVAVIAGALAARAREQAERAARRATETDALYALSQQISTEVDLERILSTIAATTCRLLEAPRCTIALYDADGALRERCAVGEASPQLHVHRVLMRDGAAVLGAIAVYERAPRRSFRPREQRLLEGIAAQARLAVDRANLVTRAASAQAAVESDRLKSALLSSVSHDLRTPLATIKGASSTLIADDVVLEPPMQRELARTIDRETDRLNRLVGNWLDIARIEGGGLRLDRDWQDIAEIVGAATSRRRAADPSRTLTVDVPAGLPLVWANAALLDQVLTNLLENAAKYAPSGTPIAVAVRVPGSPPDTLSVTVRDRGPGIAPEDLTRVFEAFYRSPHTAAERSGSGLGLAICRGIVEAHGGRIWAERSPEGGATFAFTIPTRTP